MTPNNPDTQPTVTEALEPCPFCNGPAKIIRPMGDWVGVGKGVDGGSYAPGRYRVVCAGLYEKPTIRPCPGRMISDVEAEAITAWNTRHCSQKTARSADGLLEIVRSGYYAGFNDRPGDRFWQDHEAKFLRRIEALTTPPADDDEAPDAEEDDRSWLGDAIDRIDAMDEAAAEPQYLIRKGGAYYRANAAGYTMNVAEAGRYTLDEAIKHSHPNGPDGPRDGIDYMLAPTPEPVGPRDDGGLRAALEKIANHKTHYAADCIAIARQALSSRGE